MQDILPQTTPSGNHEDTAPKSPAREGLSQFDPARLRLSQDFGPAVGVKKALLTVPVRKPSKEWFVQTHPSEEYRIQTAVLELKEDRETYLVDPSLWPELSTESTFGPRAIFTSITRQGVVFLWPIRLPGPDGKLDDWNQSGGSTLRRWPTVDGFAWRPTWPWARTTFSRRLPICPRRSGRRYLSPSCSKSPSVSDRDEP